MLTHENPVVSANYLADYVNRYVTTFPEYLQEKALEVVRAPSPVDRLVNGIELLLAIVLHEDDTAEREVALNALGSAAQQVIEIGYAGKVERAFAMVKFARKELGEWPAGVDEPETPALEPDWELPAPILIPSLPLPPTA